MRRPYDDRRWPYIRAAVLRRDGGVCQVQLKACTKRATAVDHIIPWRDGGAWFDLSNLRAACHGCNTALASKDRAERARAQRAHSRQW